MITRFYETFPNTKCHEIKFEIKLTTSFTACSEVIGLDQQAFLGMLNIEAQVSDEIF